jgi:hypothetical protein
MDLRHELTDEEVDDVCESVERSLERYLGNEPIRVTVRDQKKMEDYLSVQYDMRLSDLLVEKHASFHSLGLDIRAKIFQKKQDYIDKKNKIYLK